MHLRSSLLPEYVQIRDKNALVKVFENHNRLIARPISGAVFWWSVTIEMCSMKALMQQAATLNSSGLKTTFEGATSWKDSRLKNAVLWLKRNFSNGILWKDLRLKMQCYGAKANLQNGALVCKCKYCSFGACGRRKINDCGFALFLGFDGRVCRGAIFLQLYIKHDRNYENATAIFKGIIGTICMYKACIYTAVPVYKAWPKLWKCNCDFQGFYWHYMQK